MYYKFIDINNKSWTVYGETEEVAKRNYKRTARQKYKNMTPMPDFGVRK